MYFSNIGDFRLMLQILMYLSSDMYVSHEVHSEANPSHKSCQCGAQTAFVAIVLCCGDVESVPPYPTSPCCTVNMDMYTFSRAIINIEGYTYVYYVYACTCQKSSPIIVPC